MTDPSYRDKWEWNKNLIITYETEAGDLSPDIIEKNIAGLLLR